MRDQFREKLSGYLVGLGFHEMLTNSITNAAYFDDEEQKQMVRMLNSPQRRIQHSAQFPVLKTALEVVARNLNHKTITCACLSSEGLTGPWLPGSIRNPTNSAS